MTIATIAILSGLLTFNGQPASDQRILVVNEQADSILYAVDTDSAGHFVWDYPEQLQGEKVHLITKLRTMEVAAAKYVPIQLSGEMNVVIDIRSEELQDVSIKLTGKQGVPESFMFHLNALSVSGIPDELVHFLAREDDQTGGTYYYPLFDSSFVSLKIMKGIYSLNAWHFTLGKAFGPGKSPPGFETISATNNGLLLKEVGDSGFVIEVKAKEEVVLEMALSE